eukprot:1151160-Karenia_brevis.AAC.1
MISTWAELRNNLIRTMRRSNGYFRKSEINKRQDADCGVRHTLQQNLDVTLDQLLYVRLFAQS